MIPSSFFTSSLKKHISTYQTPQWSSLKNPTLFNRTQVATLKLPLNRNPNKQNTVVHERGEVVALLDGEREAGVVAVGLGRVLEELLEVELVPGDALHRLDQPRAQRLLVLVDGAAVL